MLKYIRNKFDSENNTFNDITSYLEKNILNLY